METTITLPLWLFVVLLAATALLFLDRILLPGARAYLRRRVNRVIDEVNKRLDIEIRPFQLTRKQALVDQLVFDDKVVAAMKEYAAENDVPREAVQARVVRYANEIVPAFNAYLYFRLGYSLAKTVGRMLYRVRVGFYDDDELAKVDPEASVVFVMNHRSNMDYVLVSFLAAERTALSYAVGEWARIWPLQTLIRAMGAFFVRRNSKNPLYRKVLERYVHYATRAGVPQAVFLEGGLSRDGLLREPKQGFLDYMLRDYRPAVDRDVVFVPVGINYDRVIEDLSLVRRLDPQAERRSIWFVLRTSFRFGFKTLLMKREKRWLRFGYACVNFGRPLSMTQFCRDGGIDLQSLDTEARYGEISRLSHRLMRDVARVVPILPVALLCDVFVEQRESWHSELEIKSLAAGRIDELQALGAPVRLSLGAREAVLNRALGMLEGRGFVENRDGLLRARDGSLDVLQYYANSIRQWSPRPETAPA